MQEKRKTEGNARERKRKRKKRYIYISLDSSLFRSFFRLEFSSSSYIGMNNTTSSINTSILPVHIPNLRIVIILLCFLLYLIGYTGCLLSIVTFSSKKLRRHSTGFLFLIMAFVDMFNLLASLQYFFDVIYQINIQMISIHWCRLLTM